MKIKTASSVVVIPPDIHIVLRALSAKTGIKIKALVDRALRKAYPAKKASR